MKSFLLRRFKQLALWVGQKKLRRSFPCITPKFIWGRKR